MICLAQKTVGDYIVKDDLEKTKENLIGKSFVYSSNPYKSYVIGGLENMPEVGFLAEITDSSNFRKCRRLSSLIDDKEI